MLVLIACVVVVTDLWQGSLVAWKPATHGAWHDAVAMVNHVLRWLAATVHSSLSLVVPEDEARWLSRRVRLALYRPLRQWLRRVRMARAR